MNKLRDFKFVITLVLKLKRTINENQTKYSTLFSNSKAETNSHDADIDSILESIYNAIMTKNTEISGRRLRLDYLFSDRTKH